MPEKAGFCPMVGTVGTVTYFSTHTQSFAPVRLRVAYFQALALLARMMTGYNPSAVSFAVVSIWA